MLLAQEVLYEVDAYRVCLTQRRLHTCSDLRLHTLTVLLVVLNRGRPIFLVLIEHILESSLVHLPILLVLFLLVKDNYEIEILSYRKKLAILEPMRSDELQKGSTANARILQQVLVDF
jgi:hypothetical protein